MIDLSFVERLLELLNSSNVGSIEVKKNFWSTSVRVSKAAGFENSGPVSYHVSAAPAAPVAPAASAAPPAAAPAAEHGGERAESPVAAEAPASLFEVKSPMVGTFYAQPEPGAEPYATVGTRVATGQTMCIIEAMKIMNPIESEVAGVVREVCVQDSQPVEYGQVLFKVDLNG